jgi:3-isopropylmalate dehydrogenase
MLLDHGGMTAAGRRVEAAVAADLAGRGQRPRRTEEIGDAVAAAL